MALTPKEKKDWAELLFIKTQLSQKEIAERVGTTEKTLSNWVNDNNWKTLRTSIFITREEQLRRLYDQLNELNNAISEREKGKRFADSKEADSITKLSAAIRNLENDTSIADIIDVFIEFMNFIQQSDFKKAKEIIELQDAFIRHKLSKNN